IKDRLFPKVTAETTSVQSKDFYKTEKTHYKTPKEVKKLGMMWEEGTQHPRSSLTKRLTLLLSGGEEGFTETGCKGLCTSGGQGRAQPGARQSQLGKEEG
ncbi:hypothetical protein NP303_25120, partial [Salmonella enterica]|nr:hypothetical protein [Salmonella enterica]